MRAFGETKLIPEVFVAMESDSARRNRFNKTYSLRMVMRVVELGFDLRVAITEGVARRKWV